MGDNLYFAARGSNGFSLQRGTNASATPVFEDNTSPKDNPCRVFQFSNGGRYFAYCDSTKTVAIECATGKPVLTVPDLKRTQQIAFSPRDNVMLTFEPYVLYGPKVEGENRVPDPNLRVWNLFDGRLLVTLIAQKQTAWQPQWTDDETLAVRLVGSELQFHRNNNFERFEMKLVVPKIGGFAISRGVAPFHIACYVAAQGGQPASVQVRRVNEKFPVVITKTFFKSDRANLYWNCKGTSLLILAAVDVDSTNQSYYGEQNVALVSTNGESCMVSLDKKGPVYAVKWHPNGREFTVCYGFMPSKVTMYNLKGESVFDMAEGPRNDVFYNRFGNILLVCGFGNLAAGKMEFWDVDKRTPIIAIEVPNTTYFEWAPDGQHFITATTTPRLRIDNVYRIWNYKGQLLHEVPYNPPNELWQVSWRPIPDGAYNKFEVAKLTAEQKNEAGLRVKSATVVHPNDRLPAGAISKAGAYVPPHLRKGSSRGALSNNTAAPTQPKVVSEAEKKQRALQKKLDEISKLKDRQAKGDALEVNQLAKIQKEAELVAELEKLKLESEAN